MEKDIIVKFVQKIYTRSLTKKLDWLKTDRSNEFQNQIDAYIIRTFVEKSIYTQEAVYYIGIDDSLSNIIEEICQYDLKEKLDWPSTVF